MQDIEHGDVAAQGLRRGRVALAQGDLAAQPGPFRGDATHGDLAGVVIEADGAVERIARMQVMPEQAQAAADVEQGAGVFRRWPVRRRRTRDRWPACRGCRSGRRGD